MELFPFLDNVEKLLVIDAVEAQLSPGTCCKFSGMDVKKYFRQKLSVHELGISEVLASLEVTGKEIAEVVIIGMQPAVLDIGLELSATAKASMPELLEMVLEQLRAWGVGSMILNRGDAESAEGE
jgi:hydrogenase maturation protease